MGDDTFVNKALSYLMEHIPKVGAKSVQNTRRFVEVRQEVSNQSCGTSCSQQCRGLDSAIWGARAGRVSSRNRDRCRFVCR